MMEKKKEEKAGGGGDLFNGVAEEVREIKWPSFRRVLGTTRVVLSVIAGSNVVLLTVNALLAELSDKVFISRGVQDFSS
ncbi:Preprotein translocase subunit SECE1 [Linum perenne]